MYIGGRRWDKGSSLGKTSEWEATRELLKQGSTEDGGESKEFRLIRKRLIENVIRIWRITKLGFFFNRAIWRWWEGRGALS